MVRKKRQPLSPLTVIGELLLLAGLGVLGFIVWQPWYSAKVVGGEQTIAASELSAEWDQEAATTEESNHLGVQSGTIPITQTGATGDIFGIMYIPALGKEYSYKTAEGIGRPLPLDNRKSGIGRYPKSAKPGEDGNFAVAAHRNGPLAPFRDIEYLRVGDPIYLETRDGWYTYTFRNQEVVTASTTEVLNPFPYIESARTTEKMMTLTSCHPKNGAALRIISYAVLASFTPRSDGPPAELAAINPNVGRNA